MRSDLMTRRDVAKYLAENSPRSRYDVDAFRSLMKEPPLCGRVFRKALSIQSNFDALASFINLSIKKALYHAQGGQLCHLNNYMAAVGDVFPNSLVFLVPRIEKFFPLMWSFSTQSFSFDKKRERQFPENRIYDFELIICSMNEFFMGPPEKEKKWKSYLENADEAAIIEILRSLSKDKPYKGFDPEGILKILIGIRNRKARKGSKR